MAKKKKGLRQMTAAERRAHLQRNRLRRQRRITGQSTAMNYSLSRGSNLAARSFTSRTVAGTKTGSGSSYSTRIKQAALNTKAYGKQTAKQLEASRKNIQKAIKARWGK